MRLILMTAAALALTTPTHAKSPPTPEDLQLAAAEKLIDAFYSFDPAPLRAALAGAPKSAPVILYYQGWAEGGNYEVRDRKACEFDKPNEVRCAITVKDDLIGALGTGFDVTDVFHISFDKDRIAAVRTSSNDPPDMKQGFDWLVLRNPDFLKAAPCDGFFAGGPTPQDCVRAVVKGFAEFRASRKADARLSGSETN